MITNLIMAILISAAGVSTNLVKQPTGEQGSVQRGKRKVPETPLQDGLHLQCARTGDRQENLRVERRPPKLHPSTDGNLQSDRRQTG